MNEDSPPGYWRAADTRHMDGVADGSLAPALAVNIAAFFSAAATASGPVEPFAPMASNSAWYKNSWRVNYM